MSRSQGSHPPTENRRTSFGGTAKKKNRKDKVAQRSLVPAETKEEVSYSDDDSQPEFGDVATVIKPQKYVSSRSINAQRLIAGMKRHNLDSIR